MVLVNGHACIYCRWTSTTTIVDSWVLFNYSKKAWLPINIFLKFTCFVVWDHLEEQPDLFVHLDKCFCVGHFCVYNSPLCRRKHVFSLQSHATITGLAQRLQSFLWIHVHKNCFQNFCLNAKYVWKMKGKMIPFSADCFHLNMAWDTINWPWQRGRRRLKYIGKVNKHQVRLINTFYYIIDSRYCSDSIWPYFCMPKTSKHWWAGHWLMAVKQWLNNNCSKAVTYTK